MVNGGDHPSSKMTNVLTATFPNLPKIEKGTEVNKTASKIIRKKSQSKMKSILKTTAMISSSSNSAKPEVTERNQRIVGYCDGAPVYMPEAWQGKTLYVKNMKYRHKNPGQGEVESDAKKEEVDDIKDEELEEDGKPHLSKKEKTRQRLLALCWEECGEKKAQTATDGHLKRHAGQRPFLCAECPKKFKKSNQLEIHQKRKHKSLSHICDICGKHYENSYYITEHKKTVHGKLENLPCEVCGKVFTSRSRLKDHVARVHTENSYHQCSLCGIKMRMTNIKVNIFVIFYIY